MGVVEVLDPVAPTRTGGWKVDVGRGERNGRVSSEWFPLPRRLPAFCSMSSSMWLPLNSDKTIMAYPMPLEGASAASVQTDHGFDTPRRSKHNRQRSP